MNFAASLRLELADRAQTYAQAEGLPHCLSYGDAPSVCFAPYAELSTLRFLARHPLGGQTLRQLIGSKNIGDFRAFLNSDRLGALVA
jgi:hypothetical protein